jgi:periplasmic copper chaperone A
MIRKLAVVAVVVTGVVMLTAGAAFAHVEIERDGEVSGQGVVKATLSVPNESHTIGTKTIELVFPTTPKLTTATAESADGFTATVNKDPAGDITSITWTGGQITGEDKAEFPLTLGDFPAGTKTAEFKALQTYDDGTVVRWIEPTPASGEEPEHPAPVLYVKGEAPHEDAADASGAATTGHQDSDSHDDGMSAGAIVAIVLGVIILAALIVFLVMRARRGSKTPTS